MNSVKIFRVKGTILKRNNNTHFSKDLRALTPEHAVEKVYTDLGSHHRVKRVHVKISSIEEITWEETNDLIIKTLSKV